MAQVLVGRCSSHCSECGGNADPNDKAHIRGGPKSGYTEGSSLSNNNGCGAEFTERVDLYILHVPQEGESAGHWTKRVRTQR